MSEKCAGCGVPVEQNLSGEVLYSDHADMKYALCYGCMNFLHNTTIQCMMNDSCSCPWCVLEKFLLTLDRD